MRPGPFKILAIDSASCMGWAVGMSDGNPRSGFVPLGGENPTPDTKLSHAMTWMNKMMVDEKPDIIMIEASFINPLKTSDAQIRLAYGFLGVYRAVASYRGCFRVFEPHNQSVASYFISAPPKKKGEKSRPLDSEQKKLMVRKRCLELGWITEEDTNLDQTDALAVWAYGVGKHDQPNAIRFSPLFTKA